MSFDPGAQEIVIDMNVDNEFHSGSEVGSSEEDNSGWEDNSEEESSEEESSEEESSEGEEAEPQEIVIDEDVDNELKSLTHEFLVPPPMSFYPAQEIVIDEDVDNELHSGALRERLQDPSPR